MHRPGEPKHDIVAFGQETDGPLGLEARGILRFLAERPARCAPYGQNNFSQRYRTLVEHFSVFLQKWRAMVEVRFLRCCVDPNAPKEPLESLDADRRQRQTAATTRPKDARRRPAGEYCHTASGSDEVPRRTPAAASENTGSNYCSTQRALSSSARAVIANREADK